MVARQPTALAFIPARAGSQRVPHKNVRVLAGHPLLAYAIASARLSEVYERIIVSTDSELIRDVALHYGAEAPFVRPAELATATSPDIEWIRHALGQLEETYDSFSILRPTSPFRQAETIQRAWKQFRETPEADSLRAVELCREHPGKMWVLEGRLMRPLLDQSHLEVAWHAGQYQALPKVYVQNSALEIAWTRVVQTHNSREGKAVTPFFTTGVEGMSIDYEHDMEDAQRLITQGKATLPMVDREPFPMEQAEWSPSR